MAELRQSCGNRWAGRNFGPSVAIAPQPLGLAAGMGTALGPVTYQTEPSSFLGQAFGSQRLYGEETAREIDVAVRGIIEAQFQRARALLATNRALLDEAARVLLAKETLAGEELEGILGRVGKESGPRIAATA